MSIREALQKNPAVGIIAALLLAAVAIGLITRQLGSSGEAARSADEAFFSTDDGQTWFAADKSLLAGFEHEGRPAYRAYVFKAPGGEPFVGYLERYTSEARQELERLAGSGQRPDAMTMRGLVMAGQEIKKPGGDRWFKRTDPGAQDVLRIAAPDGSADGLEPVLP